MYDEGMRRAVFVGLATVAVAACALDQTGLLDDGDDGGDDAIQPCTTLDAACLGALDPSWKPIALADGGCGLGFSPETWKTNPRDVPGSCVCGACEVVGSYACEAGVAVRGGNTCTDNPIAIATPGVCTNNTATQHIEAYAVQATGTVGCFAPNDAGTGAVTDDLDLCVPGCYADFCGGSPCVYAEGDVACPSGFTFVAHAGTGADPGCAPCACEAGAPGTCGGTVTAYYNLGCDAGDEAGTFGIQSGCGFIGPQYQSVLVELVPPDAGCSVTGASSGDASLTGEKTICCQ